MGAKKSRTNNDDGEGSADSICSVFATDVPQSADFRDSKGDPAWWLGSG